MATLTHHVRHDASVDVARVVLDYVKALAWPLIVLTLALTFRDEVRRLLRRIKSAKGAGAEVEFGEDAQAVTAEAVQVAAAVVTERVQEARQVAESEVREVQDGDLSTATEASTAQGTTQEPSGAAGHTVNDTPESGSQASEARQRSLDLLNSLQDDFKVLLRAAAPATALDPLRSMARVHPAAAIMAAYREVEIQVELLFKEAFSAPDGERKVFRTPRDKLKLLTVMGLPEQVAGVVASLSRLRNEVTHGKSVDAASAQDYVQACAAALTLLELYKGRLIEPQP